MPKGTKAIASLKEYNKQFSKFADDVFFKGEHDKVMTKINIINLPFPDELMISMTIAMTEKIP